MPNQDDLKSLFNKYPRTFLSLLCAFLIIGGIFIVLSTKSAKEREHIYAMLSITPSYSPYPTIKPITPQAATPLPNITIPNSIIYNLDQTIWLENLSNKHKEMLTSDTDNYKFGLSVSPDRTKVAYGFLPNEESQRIRPGYYIGFDNGIAVTDTRTQKTTILVNYSPIQRHYLAWSPDGKYISFWEGNGEAARIINSSNGEEIFSVTSPTLSSSSFDNNFGMPDDIVKSVSPFFWINNDTVSYSVDGSIYKTNIHDKNPIQVIGDNVQSFFFAFESPNIPSAPIWSKDQLYVTYYKDNDLYFFDTYNKSELLIGPGKDNEYFGDKYRNVYVVGLDSLNQGIYIAQSAETQHKINFFSFLSLDTTNISQANSALYDPIGRKLAVTGTQESSKLTIIDRVHNSTLKCDQTLSLPSLFNYQFFSQTPYSTNSSPDGNYILEIHSTTKDSGESSTVNALNTNTCENTQILSEQGYIYQVVWLN
ncbi:hypothetical protein HGA91_05335 [candidate division WWE3 bacterium]|nr:hypothetical protein [candidate division WWE3 bacterium]